MNRGYIKMWRKIEDNEILGSPDLCQLLMFLMIKATHKPHKIMVGDQLLILQPGQYFAGRKQLAMALRSTEQRIRTGLKRLEKCQIINQQPTSKGTIISLINWAKYQDDQPAANQPPNQHLTSTQPAPNQHLTTKQTHNTETHSTEEFKDSPQPPSRGQGAARPGRDKSFDLMVATYNRALPELSAYGVHRDKDFWNFKLNVEIDQARASPEFWAGIFAAVSQNSYLMGREPSRPGRTGIWRADLSWLLEPDNVAKILNNGYPPDGRTKTEKNYGTTGSF